MSCGSPICIPRKVYSPNHGGRITRYFLVPCGRCVDCLKARQMSYAFRAEWEALDPSNVQCLFVTLTYAPEFLPEGNELSKLDLQKFIRRLKLNCPNVRVRYMACGEHGTLYDRAHYHLNLFFDKYIDYDCILKAWPLGIVDIAPFTSARGGYVAKYSVKQLGDDTKYKQEPFILISNSLGRYFMTVHSDFIIKNNINCWYNLSGSPVVIPRLFIDKMFPPQTATTREKEFVSKAFSSSLLHCGNKRVFKQSNKMAYDYRLSFQTELAGYSDPLKFSYDKQQGVSFRVFNQSIAILSRVRYEIGRY